MNFKCFDSYFMLLLVNYNYQFTIHHVRIIYCLFSFLRMIFSDCSHFVYDTLLGVMYNLPQSRHPPGQKELSMGCIYYIYTHHIQPGPPSCNIKPTQCPWDVFITYTHNAHRSTLMKYNLSIGCNIIHIYTHHTPLSCNIKPAQPAQQCIYYIHTHHTHNACIQVHTCGCIK